MVQGSRRAEHPQRGQRVDVVRWRQAAPTPASKAGCPACGWGGADFRAFRCRLPARSSRRRLSPAPSPPHRPWARGGDACHNIASCCQGRHSAEAHMREHQNDHGRPHQGHAATLDPPWDLQVFRPRRDPRYPRVPAQNLHGKEARRSCSAFSVLCSATRQRPHPAHIPHAVTGRPRRLPAIPARRRTKRLLLAGNRRTYRICPQGQAELCKPEVAGSIPARSIARKCLQIGSWSCTKGSD